MSPTTKAIAAVVIFGVTQLTLLLYSASHPGINGLVTGSFVLGITFYVVVFDYHARAMRTSRKRSSASFPDSN